MLQFALLRMILIISDSEMLRYVTDPTHQPSLSPRLWSIRRPDISRPYRLPLFLPPMISNTDISIPYDRHRQLRMILNSKSQLRMILNMRSAAYRHMRISAYYHIGICAQRHIENDSHYHSQKGFPQVFHRFSTGQITIKHYHAHF